MRGGGAPPRGEVTLEVNARSRRVLHPGEVHVGFAAGSAQFERPIADECAFEVVLTARAEGSHGGGALLGGEREDGVRDRAGLGRGVLVRGGEDEQELRPGELV